jgi:hypothetical protein
MRGRALPILKGEIRNQRGKAVRLLLATNLDAAHRLLDILNTFLAVILEKQSLPLREYSDI